MIEGIWEGIKGVLNGILDVVFFFLPTSPFKNAINMTVDNDVLKYVNWFLPFSAIVSILVVWTGAIIVFYAYQIILRWVKAIGD